MDNIKYVTPAEAVSCVKSGDGVYFQGSTAVPEILQQALADRAPELRDVKVYSAFCIPRGVAPFCKMECREAFIVRSLFLCADQRAWVASGDGNMIPAFLGEIPFLFRSRQLPVNVAFINCSLPDENGYCSYGISADLAVSAVESADYVVAQINKSIPYLYGGALIHISKIHAAVECDIPPVAMEFGEPTEIERAIGNNIASEIPDGATLQIGVGGIPNAVLNAIKHHKHLGLHTEAMTDGVVRLMEEGVIDNTLKKFRPGKGVASLALGSKHMYEFLHYNKDVEFYDVALTNDPQIIRQNPKVMAINSALEIDLTGQICADSIGEKIFSSVGGQHDFMYGGALSEGGKTFIALPSATSKGKSKIVPTLTPGAGVVTTRFQAQYIATEYGIAYLRNKDLAERAKALIAIAHPAAREELEKAAVKRFGYSFLRLKP